MFEIRHAAERDVDALREIKTHFVLHTHSMFDTTPPTRDDVAAWLSGFAEGTPHQVLVAVADGRLAGYASTAAYRPKAAFDGTVEMSIYLRPDEHGRGVGSQLYTELFSRGTQAGTRTYLAGIALPNDASLAFHRRHGFVEVGTFVDYAHKWNRPISSTWLQRTP